MSKAHLRIPGVIERQHVYTLDEFRQRTGMGDAAMRTARRAGLRVVRFKNRSFVRGADFLDFLDAVARDGEALEDQ